MLDVPIWFINETEEKYLFNLITKFFNFSLSLLSVDILGDIYKEKRVLRALFAQALKYFHSDNCNCLGILLYTFIRLSGINHEIQL